MKLNVKYNQGFGKIKAGLILQILMDGFNGILDIVQVEDVQTMKEKMLDGKKY